MTKKVSILIPVHNRVNVTLEGLKSLTDAVFVKSKINFEIIVIDDGSTDGTSEKIIKLFPKVHLLKGDGGLWWSGCINLGSRFALQNLNSDYLLLWNDDVIPSKNYFQVLNDYILSNHPINAVVGSKICFFDDPKRIWSAGGMFSKWSGTKYTIKELSDPDISIINCQWQPGMGTLVPRFVMKEKDLYWDDKKYPQYYGDSDFSLRCLKEGIPVITNLNLLLFNRTELTGNNQATDFKSYLNSLFSIRSFYEIKRNLMFYTQHGILPFAYFGLLKKYFIYTGSVFKKIIKR